MVLRDLCSVITMSVSIFKCQQYWYIAIIVDSMLNHRVYSRFIPGNSSVYSSIRGTFRYRQSQVLTHSRPVRQLLLHRLKCAMGVQTFLSVVVRYRCISLSCQGAANMPADVVLPARHASNGPSFMTHVVFCCAN